MSTQPAPPAAIVTLRAALDKATLVDDNPAYILGEVLNALSRDGWQIVPAGTTEGARVRLWLIEQTLQHVDASQDPAGIAGNVGPYLDGPLHPDHIAAYHAARSGQQEHAAAYPTHHVDGTPPTCGELHPDTTACVLNNDHDHPHDDGQGNQWTGRAGRRNARSLREPTNAPSGPTRHA